MLKGPSLPAIPYVGLPALAEEGIVQVVHGHTPRLASALRQHETCVTAFTKLASGDAVRALGGGAVATCAF